MIRTLAVTLSLAAMISAGCAQKSIKNPVELNLPALRVILEPADSRQLGKTTMESSHFGVTFNIVKGNHDKGTIRLYGYRCGENGKKVCFDERILGHEVLEALFHFDDGSNNILHPHAKGAFDKR